MNINFNQEHLEKGCGDGKTSVDLNIDMYLHKFILFDII